MQFLKTKSEKINDTNGLITDVKNWISILKTQETKIHKQTDSPVNSAIYKWVNTYSSQNSCKTINLQLK